MLARSLTGTYMLLLFIKVNTKKGNRDLCTLNIDSNFNTVFYACISINGVQNGHCFIK